MKLSSLNNYNGELNKDNISKYFISNNNINWRYNNKYKKVDNIHDLVSLIDKMIILYAINYLLRLWFFFLSSEESIESNISNMDNFESDSRKISDGVTFSS